MGYRPCETCRQPIRDVDATGEPGRCPDCTTPQLDEARPLISRLRDLMWSMTDDERVTALALVLDGCCVHCGALRDGCQCMNDE